MHYLVMILLFACLSIGGGAYVYVQNLQSKIEVLRENNAKLEVAFETQKAENEALQKDFALQTESLNELSSAKAEIQAEMNRYLDIFKRHNLTKLSAAKPGLIEKRVNKGTKDVFDSIEADSSAIDALDN